MVQPQPEERMTLEQVLKLVKLLTPENQEKLIERVQLQQLHGESNSQASETFVINDNANEDYFAKNASMLNADAQDWLIIASAHSAN
jgi:hypothetical protein